VAQSVARVRPARTDLRRQVALRAAEADIGFIHVAIGGDPAPPAVSALGKLRPKLLHPPINRR
ncbi:MAG: hypothetical protein AAFR01_11835, partial [Pseudomonadota bacterium]